MLWWKIRISNLRWCNPDLIPDLWFCSTSLYNSITLKLGDIFKTKAWLNFLNIKRNIKCCFNVISVFKIPNENIQHNLKFHYVEVKCKHGAGKFKIFNSKTTSNFSPTLSTRNRNSKSVEICLFIGFFWAQTQNTALGKIWYHRRRNNKTVFFHNRFHCLLSGFYVN